MATVLLPHNEYDAEHLALVAEQMAELGTPVIRAFEALGMIAAIEGSHRLRAAEATGTPVQFEILNEGDTIDLAELDIDTNGWFDENVVSAGDLIAWWTKDGFPMGAATVEVEAA